MELRLASRRCLEQFAEIQARLADFHRYAVGEIEAALRDCLLLDHSLSAQAAHCLDSVRLAAARLEASRPLLLFSGPGAAVTVARHLLHTYDCGGGGGDGGDDPSLGAEEAAAADGFGRLRGLLRLRHNDSLVGRTVRLRQVASTAAEDAASAKADATVREFVDWVAAGQWLADRGPDELLEEDELSGNWELELRCPDLDGGLQVLVAPRLSRWTRGRLRHLLPECALFLHHVDFAGDIGGTAETDGDRCEAEFEVAEAVEHCVLYRPDQRDLRDIMMVHGRLHFICHLGDGQEHAERHQRAVELVDARLRDFMPDAAERRRRAVIDGQWELHRLLERQLMECSQATLRQLLADLGSLGRAVRAVCNCRLAKEASNRGQHRSQSQYDGDLARLQTSAKSAARSFQRAMDGQLGDLSAEIESRLRRQEVKDRLASAFVQFCSRQPSLPRPELEQFMLELVGQELHNWNRETQVFLKLDRSIWRLKAENFKQLCRVAEKIPEMVALSSDSFCEPPQLIPDGQPMEDSLSSRTILSVGIRQIGGQTMKRSFLQSLAVGIGMPLFVPLAAITMAIFLPVTFARRMASEPAASGPRAPTPRIQRQLSRKSTKELYDQAWDFFDKIERKFINDNFFQATRHFLQEDKSKLEQFIDRYCILPQDLRKLGELKDNPQRLRFQLVNFQKRTEGIVAEAKLFGATRFGYGMLQHEQCVRLGIDCGVASDTELGERIGGGSFSAVFALPCADPADPGRPQLAVKLINASSTGSALLEIEMMRQLEADRHPNLLCSLGSVYFPALKQIGLLMPRCACNLRQLLQQHSQLLVPAAAPSAAAAAAALTSCLRLFQQIQLGVRHLHGKRILHRDLKLENVLAQLPDACIDPGQAQLRICDFGFAKEEETMSGSSFVGTIGYLAPEVAPPLMHFSVKSDVYALGVMLWECYYGVSAPRLGSGQIAVMLGKDSQLDFLIRLMTHSDRQERPHIEQCIAMVKLRQRCSECQVVPLISYEDSLRDANLDAR